jgi:hypothetical protein
MLGNISQYAFPVPINSSTNETRLESVPYFVSKNSTSQVLEDLLVILHTLNANWAVNIIDSPLLFELPDGGGLSVPSFQTCHISCSHYCSHDLQ